RRATVRNITYAKNAAADSEGNLPPQSKIWSATRHKDFGRNIRYFLWMLIHDAYYMGFHWKDMPGHDYKEKCQKCGVTESMELHILTKCEARGRKQVWDLASEAWQLKTGQDLSPTPGEIMACGTITKGNTGETRLYRILVSESAFLIWCLRNARVIGSKGEPSEREIRNRWLRIVNNRIALDCALTESAKYGHRSLKKSIVCKTWSKVLLDEDRLPDDWMRETGVLVGI
ncbi:hypothetical protein DFH07DRAFT_1007291, partial [Mycena maculata]